MESALTPHEPLRIQRTVGEVQFDRERWETIQKQTVERGRSQRGVPRAKDPARYPLACRLVDQTDGCGSVLYGRTTQKRAVHTCGRYMKSSGAECASNQVDAEAMLRFTLKTLRQLVDCHGNREKLRQKLLERVGREAASPETDLRAAELARLRARQAELQEAQAVIEHRMARERDDTLYAVLTRQYSQARTDLTAVEENVRRLEAERTVSRELAPMARVEAALAVLDDVTRILADPAARAELNPLFQRLGLRIGLTFGEAVKGKKRKVQRLVSGRTVFGDEPLPVPLFGKDNVGGGPCRQSGSPHGSQDGAVDPDPWDASGVVVEGRMEKSVGDAGAVPAPAADGGDRSPHRPTPSRPEGVSITKGSRGDKTAIELFIAGVQGWEAGLRRRMDDGKPNGN